jgi:hypothetical protein
MNRLTIKLLIATLAILTTVSFTNHTEAQTPPSPQSFATSSAYIIGASGRDYITPFAGFGVSMLPDSCFAYANIASDTTKITYLLTTQIKDMIAMYNSASCNTETTPSTTCNSYIDTINNLTLTFATYQVEGLKQAKEKTYICNADNTRKPNVYKKTYYGIDIVALTYASVRDAYVNKKFTDYATLLNNVNKNLVSKLNAAVTADKFVDATPSSANLRTLAQITFKTNTTVVTPRSRVAPQAPSAVLSMPNIFLFFGLTNNVTDKRVGHLAFRSLQEYVNTFNANKTRFAEMYSAGNRDLIQSSVTLFGSLYGTTTPAVPANTPPIVQQQPPTQKASVINSIGNWFGGIWTAISDFFGYMFWGERAGAKVAATTTPAGASGTGASGSGPYPNACPDLYEPVPKPKLYASKKYGQGFDGFGYEGINYKFELTPVFFVGSSDDIPMAVWSAQGFGQMTPTKEQKYYLDLYDKFIVSGDLKRITELNHEEVFMNASRWYELSINDSSRNKRDCLVETKSYLSSYGKVYEYDTTATENYLAKFIGFGSIAIKVKYFNDREATVTIPGLSFNEVIDIFGPDLTAKKEVPEKSKSWWTKILEALS